MKEKLEKWYEELKLKCKNYGFWLSLGAALVYLLQQCGVTIEQPVAEGIVNGICGVLIVLGIVNNPDKGKFY